MQGSLPSVRAEEPSEEVELWLHCLFLFWENVKVLCEACLKKSGGGDVRWAFNVLGGRGVEWSVSYCVTQASLELSM